MATVVDALPESDRTRISEHLQAIGRELSTARVYGQAALVDGYAPGSVGKRVYEGDVIAGLDFVLFSCDSGSSSIELGAGVIGGYHRPAQVFRAVTRSGDWFCLETSEGLGLMCDDLTSRAVSSANYTNLHTRMGRDSSRLDDVLRNSPQSASVMAAESCSFIDWPSTAVSSKTGALVATNRGLFASADRGNRGWTSDWQFITKIAQRRGRLGGIIVEIHLDDEDEPRLVRTRGEWTDMFIAELGMRTGPI